MTTPRAVLGLLGAGMIVLGAVAPAHAQAPRAPTSGVRPAAVAGPPPGVRALCAPCSVAPGQETVLTARVALRGAASLVFDWRAAAGSIASPGAAETAWKAPAQPGAVPVAVTVTTAGGAVVSDVITVQVVEARPAPVRAGPVVSSPRGNPEVSRR